LEFLGMIPLPQVGDVLELVDLDHHDVRTAAEEVNGRSRKPTGGSE
jgi:hypothetical protein